MPHDVIQHLPVNHVFVDVENVKVIDPAVIGGKNLMLYLFLGPTQKRMDIEVVEKLLHHAQTVQIIRSVKSGKNALDFILAYHLGQATLADPRGYFHIVSKDSGYDALVELLKSRHLKVKRHEDWTELSFQSQMKASTPAATLVNPVDRMVSPKSMPSAPANPEAKAKPASTLSAAAGKVIENLTKSQKNRPKKEKTLIAHFINFTGKDKPDAESQAHRVLAELKNAKFISVNDKGAVSYHG